MSVLDESLKIPAEWKYTFNNRKFYAVAASVTRSITFLEEDVLNPAASRTIGYVQFDEQDNIELGRCMLIAFVHGYYHGVVRGKKQVREKLHSALDIYGCDAQGW